MRVKVKICGITNPEDALAAVDAGADALGFMFYDRSPRCVTAKAAANIIQKLPPFISKVGVFVDPEPDWVQSILGQCGLDTLQFHGAESPTFCRQFSLKTIKAFRIRDAASLELLEPFDREAWLLDSYVAGKLGGTGERFNWSLAAEAVRRSPQVILAGGLTPENVAAAVQEVRPYAVDVSSGVESAPGKKDQGKLREFLAAARSVIS